MKGPGLFSDIGKKAKDLLTKDYSCDQKLTISTYSASGVGLTSAAVKKGGLYSFDIGTQYKYKNTLVDVKVDTDSNVSTTLTMSEILPSTKTIASFKLPDYNSGKLEIQYFHDHAGVATAVALKQSPVVDLSGTIGIHGIAFGAEAGFDTASGTFTKYNAGISLGKPDYNASIILADKGDTLRASYVYHLDEMQKSAMVGEITRRFSTNENTFTVGGQYIIDPQTTVKSRLNNSGKLAALLQHELKPKSILTISGEFDTKDLDRAPKFGLALALKP
ncbi:mitochondrial outer membrane protein porin 5-like [Phoenix dactylifera]|uniref:Mitochondrial outer membrane protein porin 5-like n=1 Tax=Phoenix dactylifera TaxID=42345 RepID=A0A8B7BX72_PHODC|nr:mitochondrial outer membrane protein porin 5-like [Phoenix dactylifera]